MGVDLAVEGRVILKWILKKYYLKMWAGFRYLRIECSSRLLST